MKKNLLEPNVIIAIDTHSISNVPVIVMDKFGTVLNMSEVMKTGGRHNIRKKLVSLVDSLVKEYNVDMILLEENKLFTDMFSKYPDPYVLHNVLFGFGVNISIQDNFWDTVKYILEIPYKDWSEKVLNKSVKYSIDLYKAHILNHGFDEETINKIDINNYYRAICFGESVLHESLMNKKYQINKGES